MNIQHDKLSLFLDKGTYVITDLCYLFGKHNNGLPDEMWSEICNILGSYESGTLTIDGFKIWWGNTKIGDGTYTVRQNGHKRGKRFGVDAGLFAIIPIEFIKKHVPGFKIERGMAAKVEMSGGTVRYDYGNMWCGDICVITGEFEKDDMPFDRRRGY